MQTKAPAKEVTKVTLDSFDIFSIFLWIALLIPGITLPVGDGISFLRTIAFTIWILAFAIYIAVVFIKQKKLLFFSTSLGNIGILILAGVVLLSLFLSSFKNEALFGYNFSFSAGTLVLLYSSVLYFMLKVSGLSLEKSIFRIFLTLPFVLAIADIVSFISFSLPSSFYTTLFRNYNVYFTYIKSDPFALLGALIPLLVLHIIALVVGAWQFSLREPINKSDNATVTRLSVTQIVLASATALLLVKTVTITVAVVLISATAVIVLGLLWNKFQNKKANLFFSVLLISAALVTVGILLVNVTHSASYTLQPTLSTTDSLSIISQGFRNATVPLWRQITGLGPESFPYLYLQYRSLPMAATFGNQTFFTKPTNFLLEILSGYGILGVLAFLFLIGAVVVTYLKSTEKQSLFIEFVLFMIVTTGLLVTTSSLITIVLFFIALALYFDKYETLSEMLPNIHSFEFRELLYAQHAVSRTGILVAVVTSVLVGISLLIYVPESVGIIAASRVYARLSVAQSQVQLKQPTDAVNSFQDAYNIASSAEGWCQACTVLPYLRLTALAGIKDQFASLTADQKQNSQDYAQVKMLQMQVSEYLLSHNSLREDYLLTAAQAYQGVGQEENSSSIYALALQSSKAAVSIDPYSASALYQYIDVLLGLGNSDTVNAEIQGELTNLEQIVGTPIQVELIDGLLQTREKNYTAALKIYADLKTEVTASSDLATADKSTLTNLIDSRVADVKKLQGSDKPAKPTVSPIPTPTVTPSVTPKPTSTPKPKATVTPTP